MPTSAQSSLFGRGSAPEFDGAFATLERIPLLHGAWLDLARGWVTGHAELFDELHRGTAWRSEERPMYERTVVVPRQLAAVPDDATRPAILERMRRALSARYREEFVRVSMALYRDGRDSVTWHGDTTAREMPEACVATVSLGEPRRFLIKPTEGGEALGISLGWGDLLVMGGTCQRTYRHGVPKVARAGGRIAVMFRPVWERG